MRTRLVFAWKVTFKGSVIFLFKEAQHSKRGHFEKHILLGILMYRIALIMVTFCLYLPVGITLQAHVEN